MAAANKGVREDRLRAEEGITVTFVTFPILHLEQSYQPFAEECYFCFCSSGRVTLSDSQRSKYFDSP